MLLLARILCGIRHDYEYQKWGRWPLDARRCLRCGRQEVWYFGRYVKAARPELLADLRAVTPDELEELRGAGVTR